MQESWGESYITRHEKPSERGHLMLYAPREYLTAKKLSTDKHWGRQSSSFSGRKIDLSVWQLLPKTPDNQQTERAEVRVTNGKSEGSNLGSESREYWVPSMDLQTHHPPYLKGGRWQLNTTLHTGTAREKTHDITADVCLVLRWWGLNLHYVNLHYIRFYRCMPSRTKSKWKMLKPHMLSC